MYLWLCYSFIINHNKRRNSPESTSIDCFKFPYSLIHVVESNHGYTKSVWLNRRTRVNQKA
jgi:hypothetical protein